MLLEWREPLIEARSGVAAVPRKGRTRRYQRQCDAPAVRFRIMRRLPKRHEIGGRGSPEIPQRSFGIFSRLSSRRAMVHSSFAISRSLNFWIFPVLVLG